eukprot:EG_transcript_24328
MPLPRMGALRRAFSVALPDPARRRFAWYGVYKGKAALELWPMDPPSPKPGEAPVQAAPRPRRLAFKVSPKKAASQGPGQYDWEKGITFVLSAEECAELVLLDPRQGNKLTFAHQTPDGTDRVLSCNSIAGDKVFMNASSNGETLRLPISVGEWTVIQTLASHTMRMTRGQIG